MKTLSFLIIALALVPAPLKAANGDYRAAALEALRWIKTSAIRTENGLTWPADPRDSKSVSPNLYAGSPGVILFLIEAYRSTGDKSYLQDARAGADELIATVSSVKGSGLYTGVAGIGFALAEVFKATGDIKYRRGALSCVELLRQRAVKVGRGVEWDSTTDIIGGGAGIGLFLLYAAREVSDGSSRELAIKSAERLIEVGRAEAGGLKWAMNPGFARLMPNFSHGTAGIAYFLATLYMETRRKEFLEAALAGAKYLQSVARIDGDACLIFHNEPDGKDLFYLGWCHGPVGTARLFYRLYQATGARAWMDWAMKSARAIMGSGIPDKQTPGFWNNVSQCCGSAGVAEFFLDLYKITRDRKHLDFSKRMTAQVMAKATRDASGIKWIQAEHRVKPELLIAQTGYMQGAAGIGMLLLRLDSHERGKRPAILFPDTPFH
jgi:lantibiotic modifying enzyme